MANRKIFHGAGGSAVSQNTVSQDIVCHVNRRPWGGLQAMAPR
jgi:hypothetical protein